MRDTFIFYNKEEAMEKLDNLKAIGYTDAFMEYCPPTVYYGYYLKPCWIVNLK